jgi:hypothetical protein
MVVNKSLDELNVIVAMLRDAHASHGVVFNSTALRLTTSKIVKRVRAEGIGFLTKTLFRLGKHLDQALAGNMKLTAKLVGQKPMRGSELPILFGEFFSTIFTKDGCLLPLPDALSVSIVRELTLSFGKYKLPYDEDQEHKVINDFLEAENDLTKLDDFFALCNQAVEANIIDPLARLRRHLYISSFRDTENNVVRPIGLIIRDAREALNTLLLHFDPSDIYPRHGPGVVATKQQRSAKFNWTNVSNRITSVYPFDEYFCSSMGHVCDTYDTFQDVSDKDLPAQVLLVPKDSRGPRLISCEPVDFQWVQQGLGRELVRHIEAHPLTKGKVNFESQETNRNLALEGSINGDYATLDLKEASDRVHTELVRLLFPIKIFSYLENCRSSSTRLPSGEIIKLKKFAPMGSALCFPILSLVTWALLYGSTDNADIRKNIFVYGDDVIVPTAFAASAMAQLELFGLKVNRSKSCYAGFFRESCGMDAFKGVQVTPVRFRTVWAETPSPDTYTSWISYANSFYDKGWMSTYKEICKLLDSVYGAIPGDDMNPYDSFPSLRYSPYTERHFRTRYNFNLQRQEVRVRICHSPSHAEEPACDWSKLLRYFSEKPPNRSHVSSRAGSRKGSDDYSLVPFSVGLYTKRHVSMLAWRWR